MLIKSIVILATFVVAVYSTCEKDKNVQFQNPLYLLFNNGFFYIQGLSNGEAVVIYKHPDDSRIFGQYTFKDERCVYETVYYFIRDGKYEFTNPFINDEATFNVTNKITFIQNGAGYEIEYSISANGIGVFQNLDRSAVRQILPEPTFKKTPAPTQPIREIFPNFNNIGKQNLKVSYLRNGENFIQFVVNRNQFASVEGSYTLRTSDRRYHTVVYEIPLNDFDYNGISIREYEVATEENYFRTGIIKLNIDRTDTNVRFFVDKNGFHVNDLKRPSKVPQQPRQQGVQRPFGPFVTPQRISNNNRPINNQPAPPPLRVPPQKQVPSRNNGLLTPTFVRPDLLTTPQKV